MIIQWYGHACFKFQGSLTPTTLIIDPFDSSLGWRVPRFSADIVVVSMQTQEYAHTDVVKSTDDEKPLFLIRYPGEYEVGGIFVHTIPIEQEGITTLLSTIRVDDITIFHTGALRKKLSEKELEDIGTVDILCVGVGGLDVLDGKSAEDLASALEPRIVIPMIYKIQGLKKPYDALDPFLKEFGIKNGQNASDKLKILRKDLPSDKTEIIVLNPA